MLFECLDECWDGWLCVWMDVWMVGCVFGCCLCVWMDVWMVGCVFGWLFVCLDGCLDGWLCVWMVVWVLGWMLGLISGATKFKSKFVKFMAQKYLRQISADLWHKNIYVKFRQIYGTKIFMSKLLQSLFYLYINFSILFFNNFCLIFFFV
jgi:hypothetical protein